jgi:hypothetical protein
MRRFAALLFLLTSFLWQTAVQAGGQWLLAPAEAGHAVLHWQQEAHHHHDDGSSHAEDSDDALAHIHLDGALQGAALLGTAVPLFAAAPSVIPTPFCRVVLPLPPPDGLRRPPRSFA